MIDLSIIIPIYNVEQYLKECLESVLKIKEISTQIICIDDKSTDCSKDVLDNYKKEKNIECYYNKKNRGLAYTRNLGLKYAVGKYILFVDSDDYVQHDKIVSFIKKMELEDLELLYFDVEEFENINFIGDTKNKRKRLHSYQVDVGIHIFDAMVRNKEMFGCVWDCIYKRTFLLKNNIQFVNGILHEDIPFTFEALMKSEKVSVLNEVGYFYRQRYNSILHQSNYLKRAHGLIIGYSQMLMVWNCVAEKKDLSIIEQSINQYMSSVVSLLENNLSRIDKEEYLKDAIINTTTINFCINKNRNFETVTNNEIIHELEKCKSIALYGAGKIANEILPFLESKDIHISKIFVSQIADNVNEIGGIQVVEYTKEVGQNIEAIIIAVSGDLQSVISEYLKKTGYVGKIITFLL